MRLFLFLIASSCLIALSQVEALNQKAPPYGQLKISGRYLQSSEGVNVILRGMSLYWSPWKPQFWNMTTMNFLKCSWKASVVRAPMGVDVDGGYYYQGSTSQSELDKVYAVVDAAIQLGIYVIVDFHTENANKYQEQAITFFTTIAKKYGKYPHVLYELFNEPTTQSWSGVLKPYHIAVIKAIRAIDKDNVIIVGTGSWSQQVDVASIDPIPIKGPNGFSNIAYTLHWYAGSHTQWLRDMVKIAIKNNLPIFVTEYGTTPTRPTAAVDETETKLWWNFMEKNMISYCNWAMDDVSENTAALVPGSTAWDVGTDSKLTTSGKLVKNWLKKKNKGIISC